MKIRIITALSAALLAFNVAPALATGAIVDLITPADKARLDKYGKTRKAAIAKAVAGGGPSQVAELKSIVEAPEQSFEKLDLTGAWRCRTIKIGKNAPLVIYSWFTCKVSDDGSGWQLEKLTGSQKTKGRFFDDGARRMTYLGSYYISDAAAPKYGSGPASDQVGYVFRSGEQSWRIEFPQPYSESNLDILEFRR